MKNLWSSITSKGRDPEPEPDIDRRRAPKQDDASSDRIGQVERRLAELREKNTSLPSIEAPRRAARRSAPMRIEIPLSLALPPEPASPRPPAVTRSIEPRAYSLMDEMAPAQTTVLELTVPLAPTSAPQIQVSSLSPQRPRRLRIGEVLMQRGLVTQEQLDQALSYQKKTGERLGAAFVSLRIVSMVEIVSALAEQLGIEVIIQESIEVDSSARSVLPLDVIQRHEVAPLWADDQVLRIAMADPTNLSIVDEIRFRSGRRVQVVPADEAKVRELIARATSSGNSLSETFSEQMPDLEVEEVSSETGTEEDKTNIYELLQESGGRPVVNFVNFLLIESVRRRASDVHVEPYESTFRIRFRIDGELQAITSPPPRLHGAMISRIKVMSGMDISKRRIPQDGHLAVRHSGQVLHYRVSTLPTVYGEKAVLRLLSKEADLADLSRIGLPEDAERRLRRAISVPQGLVLVTGPTGSGKTTTVHAALNAIAKPTINVATLEDPVEMTLPGINHVQINEHSGVSFADGLRSLLRQDPDVVFVGEMRDAEVSTIAIRASLTGHLVLSTLHTNSALECFDRLDDMGVERYLVAATIQCVVAQRLLRRVCQKCATPVTADQIEDLPEFDRIRQRMAELGLPETFQRGQGCDDCMKSGYKRRVGVYEVLPIDRAFRELLRRKVAPEELAVAAAKSGFRTLYDNGLQLCSLGITTPKEVLRVLATGD